MNQAKLCIGVLALLAGCAPPPPGGPAPQPEPAHTHTHTSAQPGESADVRFMQHMIGHHAQAVVMAALVPERTTSEKVLLLARKIDISQRDEIDFMKRWLRDGGHAVPPDSQAHAMMMPGMLTAQEMDRLAAARGAAFDRLFLGYMIRHHEGALEMVEELFRTPGAAQDSDVFRFATDVDADQRDEIYAMQQLLATLPQE